MSKKYELTDNTKEVLGHTLHQIKALKSFGDVKKGDLGGWIEDYSNLSQSDIAWVYDDARVYKNAKVSGQAQIRGNAWVYDHAKVSDSAKVYGEACIYDHAQVLDHAQVGGNAWVSGNVRVYDNAKVYGDSILQGRISIREDDDIKDKYSYLIFNNTWSSGRQFVYVLSNQRWHVGCFNGTGEELIKKAYQDSELSGNMYEMYVNFAEQAVKTQAKTQQRQQPHKKFPLWLDSFPSWRGWFGL